MADRIVRIGALHRRTHNPQTAFRGRIGDGSGSFHKLYSNSRRH